MTRKGSNGECSWGDQGEAKTTDTSHVPAVLQHQVEGLYPFLNCFMKDQIEAQR